MKGGTVSELTEPRNLAAMSEVDVSQMPTYDHHHHHHRENQQYRRAFSPTVEVMRPEIVVKKPEVFSPTVELVNDVSVPN